jgi:hypothetical protein
VCCSAEDRTYLVSQCEDEVAERDSCADRQLPMRDAGKDVKGIDQDKMEPSNGGSGRRSVYIGPGGRWDRWAPWLGWFCDQPRIGGASELELLEVGLVAEGSRSQASAAYDAAEKHECDRW